MIMLLALPVIAAVALAHRYLVLYAPSNVLIHRVQATEPALRTAAAMLAMATSLMVALKMVLDAMAAGAPGSLNLVVLVLAWDGIKIGWLAIIVAVRCARWGVAAVHGADLVESERGAAANILEAGGRAEDQWQTSTRAFEAY